MYELNSDTLQRVAEKLPEPTGYNILLAVLDFSEKKGSLYLPKQYTDLEKTAAIVGYVVNMGEEAYSDVSKFPAGPYCKGGDYVMFKSYSGVRFKVGEMEFRLINDDQVVSTVPDPAAIERI